MESFAASCPRKSDVPLRHARLLQGYCDHTHFCKANVAQQGLQTVPNGSTCYSKTVGALCSSKFLHRKRRKGLSSSSRPTWWNIPFISLLMATRCSLKRRSTPMRVSPSIGPGRRWLFRLVPLCLNEQLKTVLFCEFCAFHCVEQCGVVCTMHHGLQLCSLVSPLRYNPHS